MISLVQQKKAPNVWCCTGIFFLGLGISCSRQIELEMQDNLATVKTSRC